MPNGGELAKTNPLALYPINDVGVSPTIAPAGWPIDVHPGDIIYASHINEIRDSVYQWPGDVNGGGHQLTNVALVEARPTGAGAAAVIVRRISDGVAGVQLTEDGSVIAIDSIAVYNNIDGKVDAALFNQRLALTNRGRVAWTPDLNWFGTPDIGLGRHDATMLIIGNPANFNDRRGLYVSVLDAGNTVQAPNLLAYNALYLGSVAGPSLTASSPTSITTPSGCLFNAGFFAAYPQTTVDAGFTAIPLAGGVGVRVKRASDGLAAVEITEDGSVIALDSFAVYNQIDGKVDVALFKQSVALTNRGRISWAADLNWFNDNPDVWFQRNAPGSVTLYQTPTVQGNLGIGALFLGGGHPDPAIFFNDGTVQRTAFLGSNNQTPWLQDIDGNGHNLGGVRQLKILPFSSGDWRLMILNTAGDQWDWLLGTDGVLSSPTRTGIENGWINLRPSAGSDGLHVFRASDGVAAVTLNERGDVNAINSVSVYNNIDGKVDAALFNQRLALTNRGRVAWTPDLNWFGTPDIGLGRWDANYLVIGNPANFADRRSLYVSILDASDTVNAANVAASNVHSSFLSAQRVEIHPLNSGYYSLMIASQDDATWDWLVDTNGTLLTYHGAGISNAWHDLSPGAGADALHVKRASDGVNSVTLTERGDVNALNSVSVYNGIDGKVDAALFNQRLALTYRGRVAWTPDLNWFGTPDIGLGRWDANYLVIGNPANFADRRSLYVSELGASSTVSANLFVSSTGIQAQYYIGFPAEGQYQFHIMHPTNGQWNWLVDPSGSLLSPNKCPISQVGWIRTYPAPNQIGVAVQRVSDGADSITLSEQGAIVALNSISVYNGLDGHVDVAMFDQRFGMTYRGYLQWTPDLNWWGLGDIGISRWDANYLMIGTPGNFGARKNLYVGVLAAQTVSTPALDAEDIVVTGTVRSSRFIGRFQSEEGLDGFTGDIPAGASLKVRGGFIVGHN